MLSANILAERFAAPVDKELPGRVQEAIDRILQKQLGEGSFSLWSDSGDVAPWLSAYALDFLSRAQEKGYVVPEYFYRKGMQWLIDQVKNADNPQVQDLAPLAYAHWVLARTGQGRHEDARYLFDTWFAKIPSPLAQAQLAGALALLGDRSRAIKGLKAAMERANGDPASSWRNYGSRLRNLAGIIHIIAESGIKEVDPAPAWQELTRLFAQEKYLSTQEQAWLVMASLTLEPSSPLELDIAEQAPAQAKKEEKEQPEKKKPSLLTRIKAALSFGSSEPLEAEAPASPQDEEKEQPKPKTPKSTFFALQRDGNSLLSNRVTITNKGDKAVWLVTTVQGSPVKAPEPMENGFTIFREWYNTAGEPMPVDAIQQGELMVVTLQGEVKTGSDFQALLVDLLPAGFEIERPITERDTAFSWLKDQLTDNLYVDARDDRFVAAFDTKFLPKVNGNKKMSRFQSAYLVRAVTPGIYTLPPVEVEAMYRPEYRARSGVGTVIVSGAE
ncbi:A-macroglobulin complement component [Candidatus Electrothrix marina]|uniref:A-macroglobulin complement component n=1 Tax=Candidatus Electrothrix marina TaxID=1859130 RepID=A0A444JEN8_9BACT|nr:A-macroglobulin complement component [Candidatus Electrothrix marina]